MKPKVVKHLSNIEIDEISLVDRGANQHATVAIAKRAPEEENMPELYNEEGELLDENSLVDGQIVFDQEGAAYRFDLDDEADAEDEVEDDEEEVEEVEERELASVGKAFGQSPGLTTPGTFGAQKPKKTTPGAPPFRAGAGMQTPKVGGGMPTQRPKLGAAAARPGVAKSYSEQVLEELSKAYSDEERDAVLSKAFAAVEDYQQQAEEAVMIAKSERDLRLTNEYISKAEEYNLPVDAAELGPVLYRMAESMSYEDCTVIAKCLESAGSMIFEEVGYIGGGDNVDIMDQVAGLAQETVTKSAGTSQEDAINAIFENNPSAYDEYLAQSRRGF